MIATPCKHWPRAAGVLLLAGCAPHEPAPTPSKIHPAVEADARALVRALDDAFNRDAPEAYAALHDPSWPTDLGTSRTLSLLGQGHVLQQRSEILDFHSLGAGGVALVQCEHRAVRAQPRLGSAVAQAYLMFVATDAGPLARRRVAIAPGSPARISNTWTGVYACPACNFRIGAAQLTNWLVAPSHTLASGCVEMVAFYCADDDVSVVLSIHPNRELLDAPALLANLLDRYRTAAPRPEIFAWRPPAYRDAMPDGLLGARCEFELDGRRTTLLLVTRRTVAAPIHAPEICYLITVEGTPEAVAARSVEIDVLLDSFSLVDSKKSSQEIGLWSARAHSQGELSTDGRFFHAASSISCRRPAAWLAELRADAGLFGVAFACPESDDGVTLTAYPRPRVPRDVLLQHLRERVARRLPADAELDGDWQSPPSPNPDAIEATWGWQTPTGNSPRRRGTVVVYDDVYLLVDARVDLPRSQMYYEDIVASISRR